MSIWHFKNNDKTKNKRTKLRINSNTKSLLDKEFNFRQAGNPDQGGQMKDILYMIVHSFGLKLG